MRAPPLPIATADPLVVRPRDLADHYRNPAKEFRDLARQGVLLHLAHGYYAVVPEHRRGQGLWRPPIEAVALGLAQVDYGRVGAALMGMSAARQLGVVPRALGSAVVAVPRQRPNLQTVAGRVTFVTRTIKALDLERTSTELADGWTTTIEQTLVDLLDRPALGSFDAADVDQAVNRLVARARPERIKQVGAAMRKRHAADLALELLAAA